MIPGHGERACGAHVDRRRNPRCRTDVVGLHHLTVQFEPQVRVEVDQPRNHDSAGRVQHAGRSLGRQTGRNGSDALAADGDVEISVQAAGWIQYVATSDQEVVSRHVSPPLWAHIEPPAR